MAARQKSEIARRFRTAVVSIVRPSLRLHRLPAPQSCDVRQELDVIRVEDAVRSRHLPEQVTRIDEQHLVTTRPLNLALIEEP